MVPFIGKVRKSVTFQVRNVKVKEVFQKEVYKENKISKDNSSSNTKKPSKIDFHLKKVTCVYLFNIRIKMLHKIHFS